MSTCIYCLQDKLQMNREHVIPECFGTFAGNLVLHDTVCEECNQFFGDNIDLFLGRDTIEGIERFKHGIRSAGKLKRERMRFRIEQGSLKGMIAEPIPSHNVPGEIDIDPVMQVGFFNRATQAYDYFEVKDIPFTKELKKSGYEIGDKGKPLHIIAKDDDGIKYVLDCLKTKGMDITVAGDADWPEEVNSRAKILIEGEIRVDSFIFRGMAKTAFNYLAYTAGKRFVLDDSFNPVRGFIRYGAGKSLYFCDVRRRPILHEEK